MSTPLFTQYPVGVIQPDARGRVHLHKYAGNAGKDIHYGVHTSADGAIMLIPINGPTALARAVAHPAGSTIDGDAA